MGAKWLALQLLGEHLKVENDESRCDQVCL